MTMTTMTHCGIQYLISRPKSSPWTTCLWTRRAWTPPTISNMTCLVHLNYFCTSSVRSRSPNQSPISSVHSSTGQCHRRSTMLHPWWLISSVGYCWSRTRWPWLYNEKWAHGPHVIVDCYGCLNESSRIRYRLFIGIEILSKLSIPRRQVALNRKSQVSFSYSVKLTVLATEHELKCRVAWNEARLAVCMQPTCYVTIPLTLCVPNKNASYNKRIA